MLQECCQKGLSHTELLSQLAALGAALPTSTVVAHKTYHQADLGHHMMSAGDALHYGQKLRILANPMVQGETLDGFGGSRPLYLYSRPVGTTHFAKYSRHQLVAFTDRASYDSVWQVIALTWEQQRCPSWCLFICYTVRECNLP